GNHYYLGGVSGALDSAGEWFRNSSGQLSLWTTSGDSPANHVVEAKARRFGFDLSNAAYIQIRGLHFFACSINTGSASTRVVIDHITAQYLSHLTQAANGFIPDVVDGIVLAGSG